MPVRTVLVLVLLIIAAAVLIALGSWIATGLRLSPEERERRRRLAVTARGRLADGTITEVNEGVIFYSYSVGGAGYATSQDTAELRATIEVQPDKLIGCPVTVKYALNNPANSIIVCEGWSGLRSGITGGTYDSR